MFPLDDLAALCHLPVRIQACFRHFDRENICYSVPLDIFGQDPGNSVKILIARLYIPDRDETAAVNCGKSADISEKMSAGGTIVLSSLAKNFVVLRRYGVKIEIPQQILIHIQFIELLVIIKHVAGMYV